jgi:hypothetical protein
MIRLDAVPFGDTEAADRLMIQIRKGDAFLLATSDLEEAAAKLGSLGVDDPFEIVAAAARWGAVELHAPAH